MSDALDNLPSTPATNTSVARGPWLFFSGLAILLWGVFGAVSKAASDRMSGTDLQVINTLGVVPIALLLVLSPNFRHRTGSLSKGIGYGCLTGLRASVRNHAGFVALNK